MMTPMMPTTNQAISALLLLVPLLAPPLDAQDDAVAKARARLDEARAEHEAAYQDIEELVLDLEDDYVALTTGPDAATLRHQLVLAMHDSLDVARSRIDSARSQGRPVLRGFRRDALFAAFDGPVRAAAEVDERLASWVARAVAHDLSGRDVITDLSRDDLLRIVDSAFPAGMTWFDFWNEHFREGLPEVDEYIETYEDFEEAGLELMRAQHPERYGPRGEEAPPGMVAVPGGTYTIGPDRDGWEETDAHKESIRPFFMDRREVTNREYALYVDALPGSQRQAALPRDWALDVSNRAAYDADEDLPVLYVSWSQANGYARWAGKRLPTEVEWEAAAGGVDGLTYPWGNGFKVGFANGGSRRGDEEPLPVESFPRGKSPTGCFDMAGNAWEWTATTIGGDDVETLPEGLVNMVIRGGSFRSERNELKTTYRWAAPGHDTFASPRYDRPIGFRCAKDL